MTPADAINRCLQVIRERFYHDQPERIFYRDKRALTKAILRYAYACHRMGWDFDAMTITQELLSTLIRIDASEVEYLPVFLEECIDRAVGMRAEKLGELDKLNKHQLTKRRKDQGKYEDRGEASIEKVIGRLRTTVLPDTVVVVEKSDTEVMALLYKELSKPKPKKAPVKQMSLL